MNLFDWNQEEIFTFFMVLVRYSVMISVLPFLGDRFIPTPTKILFSVAVTFCMFPMLVKSGAVHPGEALVWSGSAGGIMGMAALETLFGLILGFTARMCFEAINFGANLVGHFMGFAIASTYDPHQESETQIVAQLQMAFAMLIFLAVDGHHLMLRATLDSYRVVGMGGMSAITRPEITGLLATRLIEMSGQVIKFGLLITAPIAVSMFAVNVAFGVISKAMPQLNILVLSFAVSALVGLFVLFITLPDFQGATENILGRIPDWMGAVATAIGKGI